MFNARSIATPGNMDELHVICTTQKPDVIIVTESWLNSTHDNAMFQIDGYCLFREDRCNKIGGGVALWIKSAITVKRYVPNAVCSIGEHIFLTFKLHSSHFLLCASYLPPNRSSEMDAYLQNYTFGIPRRTNVDSNANRRA